MNAAKLKQNAFWVGCGGALLILVVLYAIMYRPKADLLATKLRTFQQRDRDLGDLVNSDTIPGRPDIDAQKAHKAEMLGKLEAMVKFYQEKDLSFESWLPQLNTKEFDTPNPGLFLAHWETEKNQLNDLLQPAEQRGFMWEVVPNTALDNKTTGPMLMKDLQKMYWIRVRIWEAIQAIVNQERQEKKPVLELQEVAFLESVYARYQGIGQAPQNYPGVGTMVGRYPGIAVNRDFVLPGGLGRTITFGISLKIKLTDLPNVLAILLDPNAKPNKMLIELLGVRVEPAETNEFKKTVDVSQENQEGDLVEHRKKVVPQPVIVRITARVLDFDKAKLEEKANLVTEAKGKN